MSYRVPVSSEEYSRDEDQRARSALQTQIEDVDRVTKRLQTPDGTISLGDGTMTLANGTNNNVAAGFDTYMQVSGPTAAFTITGIVPVFASSASKAVRGAKGRMLVLRNPTAYTMTIAHQSASSTAANRIITSSAANVEMGAGTTAILIYNVASERWHLVDSVALNLILTTLTVSNTGLRLLDTDASHYLTVKAGSNLTANRTFTLTTGDGDRTLDISAGSVTVSSFGASLVDDAAAVNARSTLGLAVLEDILTDPGADRFAFWDDTASEVTHGTFGDGLVLTDTTLRANFVQAVATSYATHSSTTATIPVDDTIPQNTEGTEIMTLAITPKATTNKLVIRVMVPFYGSTAIACIAALFQDSTANALTVDVQNVAAASAAGNVVFEHVMDAGTTSSTTFKVRVGTSTGTLYLNGFSGGRLFGGVLKATMTITEYTP